MFLMSTNMSPGKNRTDSESGYHKLSEHCTSTGAESFEFLTDAEFYPELAQESDENSIAVPEYEYVLENDFMCAGMYIPPSLRCML